MNRPPDHNDLLDAVLAESAPADFGPALLGETLHFVRRRRQWRRARRATAALALLGLLGTGVWHVWPSRNSASRLPTAGCEIVHTEPLPADAIVSTRPFGPERMIATFANVDVVRTVPSLENLRFISDDELLALSAPRLPALVRNGPHTQELIFLIPAGREARAAD